MAAHARLSPSAADRWMLCPGSVLRSQAVPESRSSEFAAEGTVMHEVAAFCIEFGMEPEDFLGQTWTADGFSFEINEERAGWLHERLDWLREQPGKLVVEHKVDLGRWLPGQFGTLDIGIVAPDVITIFDWKFGAGVAVSAVQNRQLRIYALGFWDNIARHLTKATRFRIVIAQPRLSDSEWFVELDDLLAFGEEVRVAGERTYDEDAPVVPGDKQCKWCPLVQEGGPGCAPREAFLLDVVSQKFADLDDDIALAAQPTLPRYTAITPERRAHIIEHASMFSKWIEGLKADALADGLAGRPTPGHKVVTGDEGDRKWLDEGVAEALLVKHLHDDAFTKKVKSPAQLEKVAKPGKRKPGLPELWEGAQKLITRAPGKPILVPLSDPRPARMSIEEKFSEIEDTTEHHGD